MTARSRTFLSPRHSYGVGIYNLCQNTTGLPVGLYFSSGARAKDARMFWRIDFFTISDRLSKSPFTKKGGTMNAFDEPLMSAITRSICIGNMFAAEDLDLLVCRKITYVVSVSHQHFGWLKHAYKNLGIDHIAIPIEDHLSFDGDDSDRIIGLLLGKAFLRTQLVSEGPGTVLVHCERSVSRSPAYVVAFLVWRYGMPFDEALELVASHHPLANPSPHIMDSFLRCIGKDFESEEAYEAYKEHWRAILFSHSRR